MFKKIYNVKYHTFKNHFFKLKKNKIITSKMEIKNIGKKIYEKYPITSIGIFFVISGCMTMPLISNYFPELSFKIRAKNIQYIDESLQTENMCIEAAYRITSFDFLIKNIKNMSIDVAHAIWVNILDKKYDDLKSMSELEKRIYNPMETLPFAIYEMYFEKEGILNKNKHQTQIICDSAFKVNVENIYYMKPEFRKKEMYDNLNRTKDTIYVPGIGMSGIYIPREILYFNISKYFKNEFNILVDTYYKHNDNDDDVKIFIYPRKNNDDTTLCDCFRSYNAKEIEENLRKANLIEITTDELYKSNKDKNIILNKFEHLNNKYVTTNSEETYYTCTISREKTTTKIFGEYIN